MKRISIVALALLTATALQSCATKDAAIEHIATLPAPPEGYRWEVNREFSDEFNGVELDTKIWHAHSPYWSSGRRPATFLPDCVSVADGYLQIRNFILPEPMTIRNSTYTHAGGAVASVSTDALYGYYETRMKASLSTMSSTFWLANAARNQKGTEVGEDGVEYKIYTSQELDIIETMGVVKTLEKGDKSWNKGFNTRFNSNAHYWRHYENRIKPTEDITGTKVDVVRTETDPSAEDFHTYGCWWVDANTLKFYYDGEYIFTIHPSTKYSDTPFDKSMYMHLVTETYDWEPSIPTADELEDPTKSTTLYDWVRSYKLVKIE